VRNRRFKKLQEYYPQAIKDIEAIKNNASEERFGFDKIAKNGDDWIKLMNTLKKFPNHQIERKGDVITFEIADYTEIYNKAKDRACEDHYKEGIEIMDKYKTSYFNRKKAFTEFHTSLDYGDTYKTDIYQRGATIHYDEGLRIYNSAKSFSGKTKAEEPFIKALKWVDPFKDIRDLMARLYFDEADRIRLDMPKTDAAAATLFENKNQWSDLKENLEHISAYYDKVVFWKKDYPNIQEKRTAIKEKAAAILYETGLKYAATPSYQAQNIAVDFFKQTANWIKNYKDADQQAADAKMRGTITVVVAHMNGKPVQPTEIQNALAKRSNYIEQPELNMSVDLNNTGTYPAVAEKLGKGFILVKIGDGANDFQYETADPIVSTKDIIKYTMRKKGEAEKEISKSEYNTAKFMLNTTDEDVGYSVHKYNGTVTRTEYAANVTGNFPLEIWDIRNPTEPMLIKTVNTRKTASDKIIRETYSGHPNGKPRLNYDTRALMNKKQLIDRINPYSLSVPKLINENITDVYSGIRNVEYLEM
jgi:hypothetical protein